jgi:hypothetical protein
MAALPAGASLGPLDPSALAATSYDGRIDIEVPPPPACRCQRPRPSGPHTPTRILSGCCCLAKHRLPRNTPERPSLRRPSPLRQTRGSSSANFPKKQWGLETQVRRRAARMFSRRGGAEHSKTHRSPTVWGTVASYPVDPGPMGHCLNKPDDAWALQTHFDDYFKNSNCHRTLTGATTTTGCLACPLR